MEGGDPEVGIVFLSPIDEGQEFSIFKYLKNLRRRWEDEDL